MTLNKRAFSLIFPIVLLGYVLAGGLAYYGYRAAVIGLQKARLDQEVFQLKSSYADYLSLGSRLLYVVRNSNAFLLFLNETDETYRTRALAVGIQDSLQSLDPRDDTFVSCSIFQPDGRLVFHSDNGQDPFSTAGERQRAFARAVIADEAPTRSALIVENDGLSYLLMSSLVQARTARQPVLSQREQAVLLQIAIRPVHFQALRTGLEAEYRTRIETSATPLAPNGELSAVVRLAPDLYARLTPPGSYLNGRFRKIAIISAAMSLSLSVASIGVLMVLVRRFVTGPVEELDRQVSGIMTQQRETIDVPGTGEVGRLAANVRRLHWELDQALKRTQRLYETDPVTGIGNRIYFNEMMERFFHEEKTTGQPVTMLFIDLDNFKMVNDEYGHRAGDALLEAVAHALVLALNETARACDAAPGIAARFAGDEFAVLVQAGPRTAYVQDLVRSILALFQGGFSVDGSRYPVTASIGVASAPEDATTTMLLLSCADHAMYHAKGSGRNTVAFHGDLPAFAWTGKSPRNR
ncbi:diguanylate cyclase [Gluconacetobacter azotocaptans]|uniref:Diguanylate cyclase n=1 Tax=Gluconacetobacter azotocaptans TaxID=142834 RepID=A0A7W4JQ96_9PROT|nr:diguanylate cyclase [Gluconacetobacter azotocaptans]MBB2188944.1 diguanylate cyclase [Gluconacetobacter azotocaptans]GBQ25944.1 diguanylate cyclase [Gluconacetobacter azotocaptans DSM 13594]